jgi:4-hydroxy-tetrahydrodipicolinate synthase
MDSKRLTGVIAAVATPLAEDGGIDCDRLIAHCGRLLRIGCDGINLLGTTGETVSFSAEQRLQAMEAVAGSGLPLDRFMVGTGAAALVDAVRLTARARDLGFAGALLLPPFYYKGIHPDGLVRYVESVIARVGDGLRLYLYNFPQLSGVPYTAEVVERLHGEHPGQVLGLKDSSGDLAYAAGLASRLPEFDVFPSSEAALAEAAERHFAGCISATLNVNAPMVGRFWSAPAARDAAGSLAAATEIRTALASVTLVPAVKWALADLLGDPAWSRLMPPLRGLTAEETRKLTAALQSTRYAELRSAFAERRNP